MRDITENILRNLHTYRSKCKHYKDNSVCERPKGCLCLKLAEIWAYIQDTIPDEYHHFTIQDFTGMKNNNRLLSPKMVASAKAEILKYCWDGIEPGTDYDATWISKCILEKRRQNGNSILIYGDPWRQEITDGKVRTFKNPIGKTMLASVIMKECIFQRLLQNHSADTYAWVPYQTLCHRLMQHAAGDESHASDILSYEECDWLVVDGIQNQTASEATKGFKMNVLERLFGERVDRNLPNILVFQDDISKIDDLLGNFGSSLNHIINSRKTFRVALVDKKV